MRLFIAYGRKVWVLMLIFHLKIDVVVSILNIQGRLKDGQQGVKRLSEDSRQGHR